MLLQSRIEAAMFICKKKFAPRGEESSSNSKSCAFGLEKNIEAVPLG